MSSDTSASVYFSYKWGGESEAIVEKIAAALGAHGIPYVLDKADLGYKGRIGAFMQDIGRGSAVVVVICDRYLTSPNTMYELVEMARHPDLHDRIFPVVLADADIYDAARRLKYVKHWEDKKKELSDAMRSVDLVNLQGISDDLNHYDNVRDQIAGLTSLLKDMNALTPEMHQRSNFESLIGALTRRLGLHALPQPASRTAQPQLALDLAVDLGNLLNDAQAEGLMLQLATPDGPVDVAIVLVLPDGSLECRLPANHQLPEALHWSAAARHTLVSRHGFTPPAPTGAEYTGAEFTLRTEPASAAVVAALAARIAGALIDAQGLPEHRLGWRLLPD